MTRTLARLGSEATVADYRDRGIATDDNGIAVRGYYFPWGTKRIAYAKLRSVTRVSIGALTGRGRIWGTANPRYWANLDVGRPRKSVGYILDLGRFVRPFITPDDPAAFEASLGEHAVTVAEGDNRTIV
jgi:hypothetical protein